jgi:hypothetical protein
MRVPWVWWLVVAWWWLVVGRPVCDFLFVCWLLEGIILILKEFLENKINFIFGLIL